MNVSRRFPGRLTLTLAAAALVLVIGAATALALGSGGSTSVGDESSTSVSPPDVVTGSGIAAPAWCCGTDGSVPGLTTVGQATLNGQGAAARDTAIAAAVQDATAQATAAADAAGIPLGAIIDMQVSTMPYYYPMMGASAGSGTSPGSPGGGGTEPAPGPDVYVGSASVTITWSLG